MAQERAKVSTDNVSVQVFVPSDIESRMIFLKHSHFHFPFSFLSPDSRLLFNLPPAFHMSSGPSSSVSLQTD
jgi:hypothetical protein